MDSEIGKSIAGSQYPYRQFAAWTMTMTFFRAFLLLSFLMNSQVYAWNEPTPDEIIDVARASVIRIEANGLNKDGSRYHAVGTGFFVTYWGHIETAAHIIPDQSEVSDLKITATHDLQDQDGVSPQFSLQLVGRDAGLDVALLQVEEKSFWSRPLPRDFVGPSGTASAYALGYPGGSKKLYRTNVLLQFVENGRIRFEGLTNQGHSGGPIIDTKGFVIGMVSDRQSKAGGVDLIGVNKAVPAIDFLLPPEYNINEIHELFVVTPQRSMGSDEYQLEQELESAKISTVCNVPVIANWRRGSRDQLSISLPPKGSKADEYQVRFTLLVRPETKEERKQKLDAGANNSPLSFNPLSSRVKVKVFYESEGLSGVDFQMASTFDNSDKKIFRFILETPDEDGSQAGLPVAVFQCTSLPVSAIVLAKFCVRLVEAVTASSLAEPETMFCKQ